MTTATAQPNQAVMLRSEADTAWTVYANTCQFAASETEREWAFGRAVQAEERAARAEKNTAARAEHVPTSGA